MNLLDMIMGQGNGRAVQQVGQQHGLNEQQAQQAIQALLPAISSALKKNTQQPQGLAGLLGALNSGNHAQYLDNPALLEREETRQDGNNILGHLFGSKDVSRAVAAHASQKTGISDGILKKILPLVATMAMGSLSKQTQEPSMAGQLMGLLGGMQQPQRQSGLGGLLGGLLGGGRRQQAQARQNHQQGMGLMGRMLDADGDGNTMDDILGMAMKGMMNRR